MPVDAPELGLDREWQRRVLAATGNYGDIFDRYLGKAPGSISTVASTRISSKEDSSFSRSSTDAVNSGVPFRD